ncbi:MAG: Crp/Fnr family transcriptional regulator [Candidatus Acidiferrales bacterium]
MVRPKTVGAGNPASKHVVIGNNSRTVLNTILLGLPAEERHAIFSKLEFLSLPVPMALNVDGERIKHIYFINDGLASVLKVMEDGNSIEVGLCGKEGFVGLPLLAGYSSSPTRIIMQVGGSGFRMSANDFSAALLACPTLLTSLRQFAQELALQSEQIAACNRLHDVEQRLARWLLMCQDRLGGDVVPLTHTFLAHMLGTRRASVTDALGALQDAKLVSCARSRVKIESRKKLENAACECYAELTNQIEKWHQEAGDIKRGRQRAVRAPAAGVQFLARRHHIDVRDF